ncbi:peptide ABC transporter substrate-binding protein [Dictyobacter formicarum]|uniref:Peptide ABC transporter substrate-binding protein n=1 Tax=Dictyobacter formicarum TaxID=2778368 RepID=A0ABQ3VLR1_9CHLR|nr:peptide ABC transporter substrate-binding protein [Dictyobacter formicarum]GHO86644.1 peptide ABC transporter substrate-binding protein [Dictyobacter formicarum]
MRHIRKKSALLGVASLFSILVILLSACGGGTTSNGNTPTNLASKQVLREPVIGGDFDSLDPALTAGGLGDPINLIFTGLVAADDQGNIHDQLAASHQVSSDGLTYTFTLRSNLKFSDGTKLDANDVAYSINRTIDPATKSQVSNYLSLIKDYDKFSSGKVKTLIGDSIIVKDPHTISLIISKPASYFLQALNYSTSFVVNKALTTKYGAKWVDHLNEGAGDGPFKVKSYSHTTGLVLVPNPNYYKGKPKLQEIDEIITGDRDSTFKSMKAGQFDLAPVPPALDSANNQLPGYQTSPALASRFIGMNYLVKPLDNIKIRQALELALNRNLIVGSIIGKTVTPSYHIIPDGIPGYNKDLQGPAGITTPAGNQAKAKELFKQGLQEEGYKSVSDLPSISLVYAQDYKAGADTMAAVANEWKQVLGFNVKLVGLQGTDLISQEFATAGKTGPLQMWYGSWGADYLDPQDWTTLFFDKGVSNNAFNYGQNKSANVADQQAVQTELEKADTISDQSARMKMYQDAEQKLVNDVPYITTYQSSYSYLVNPKLKGWKLYPLGSMATDDWANVYFTK